MVISIGKKKPLTKFNITSDKSPEEIRNRRNISEHNKGYTTNR
jgi:hypothetical protein